MMQYEIKEPNGFGSTWIKVIGKNAKQETMTIEIVHCENPGGKNSLPYAWYKNGWTDKVMEPILVAILMYMILKELVLVFIIQQQN